MEFNHYIDATLLENNTTMKEIETLCENAKKYHYASVCVTPYYTSLAAELLEDSNVAVTTVIGYPYGMNTTEVKSYEAIDAVNNGATEIDYFVNIAALKNKEYESVKDEIEEIRDSIDGKTLKVIINGPLTEDELIKLVELCNDTFVHYIGIMETTNEKTRETIETIKQYSNGVLEIKVFTDSCENEKLISYIEAGVTRISTLLEER